MDALQAATSAIALAELAWETALLIRRVCRAHKDAEELCQKTQNLSHLLKNVANLLKKRNERRGDRPVSEDEQAYEATIESSLLLCKTSVEGIHSTFRALVNETSDVNDMQFRDRLRFVRKRKYIAAQEQEIGIQLHILSVTLQCLGHEDQAEQRIQAAHEQQQREQSTQYTQRMHEDFLRQLFLLLQYVFQRAESESPFANTGRESEAIAPSDPPSITVERSQPPLSYLFGSVNTQQGSREQSGDEVFTTSQATEAVDNDAVNSNDAVDTEILPQESVENDMFQSDSPFPSGIDHYTIEKTFLLAVKRGQDDLVRNLLEEGADTNAKDSYGWTVLHHAVFCLNETVVKTLLEHEKSTCTKPEILNAQTKLGETALIFAAQFIDSPASGGGDKIARMLLSQEACDTKIEDGVGSALYFVVTEGKPSSQRRRSLARLLADKGADIQAVQDKAPDSICNYEFLADRISQDEERRNSTTNPGRTSGLTRVLTSGRASIRTEAELSCISTSQSDTDPTMMN